MGMTIHRWSKEDVKDYSDRRLIAELMYYLDIVEVSDNDREFRPNTISTCRVLDGQRMNEVLKEMKARIKDAKD
jgi:hypothetical protein